MRLAQPNSVVRSSAMLACLAIFGVPANAQPKTASTLVHEISHWQSRLNRAGAFITCGQVLQDQAEIRGIANSLASVGTSALPAIGEAIKSLDEEGDRSEFAANAVWLLTAYAKISPDAAARQLQRMQGDSRFASLKGDIDVAMSVALGLTSYVTRPSPPASKIGYFCSSSSGAVVFSRNPCAEGTEEKIPRTACHPLELPRESLDRLIRAWFGGDESSFRDSLTAEARGRLEELMDGRSWQELRTAMWPNASVNAAVGYRFDAPGRWAQPAISLGSPNETPEGPLPSDAEIQTWFRNATRDCGTARLRFKKVDSHGAFMYLIDSPNIGTTLEMITSCASVK